MFDYLLRNLNLFNMESMYEIRMDMEEHLPRLQPYVGENDEVKFSGWSRMAQPVSNFELVEVREGGRRDREGGGSFRKGELEG